MTNNNAEWYSSQKILLSDGDILAKTEEMLNFMKKCINENEQDGWRKAKLNKLYQGTLYRT
jgi:hypothetical protein